MDLKTIIHHYWPYWSLGIGMIIATLRSEYKDLMRIDWKALFKFVKMMGIITVFRVICMHFNPPTIASAGPILQIPLWLTFTVPWEDACHCLPLAIASRFLGENKFSKIICFCLMAMVQFSFLLGHTYEGIFSAIIISFGIPMSTRLGKKYGFATTMLGHVIYDFITLLTVKLFLGL